MLLLEYVVFFTSAIHRLVIITCIVTNYTVHSAYSVFESWQHKSAVGRVSSERNMNG